MSTPTPRTDRQAVVSLGKTWKASYDEMHEHARTLERELATERARLDSGQTLRLMRAAEAALGRQMEGHQENMAAGAEEIPNL